MKINCLSCGHNIDLDDAYDEHYEGEIKCYGCNGALEILTDQGAIRCVRLLSGPTVRTVSAEAYGQAMSAEGAQDRMGRPDKMRNPARQGVVANESGMQHASPTINRTA